MKIHYYIWVACGILVASVRASFGEDSNSWYSVFNQTMDDYEIKVRSSVFNKQSFGDPAAIQLTSPQDGGESSYSVDVGLTANLVDVIDKSMADRLVLGPSVEYHKLTSTNKPADNIQIGLDSLYQFGEVDLAPYAHIIQLAPTYKNDRIGTGEGFFGRLEYLPAIPPLAIGGYQKGPDWMLFEWTVNGVSIGNGFALLKTFIAFVSPYRLRV